MKKKNLIGVIFAVLMIILIAVLISQARSTSGTEEERVTNFPQSETELSAVKEEYKNNVYLNARGLGACDKLLGNVSVTFIFINDSESKWDENAINEFKTATEDTFKRMEKDAKSYNKTLKLTPDYRETTVNFKFNYGEHKNWSDSVLSSLDMAAYDEANLYLMDELGSDEAAIVFVLNREGRSFSSSTENTEYTVIFDDAPALYHELCHLFGANDFYFPDETELISEEVFGDSIMDNAYTGEVDDLTAYLLGWRDDISDKAEEFLKATNYLTNEQIEEAKVNS